MNIHQIISTLLMVFVLAGCSRTSTPPILADPTPLPSPKAGKAIVTGKITNKNNNQPIDIMLIRLAKIYGEGKQSVYVYNESSDPGDFTQADGTFVLEDISPGSYAVILVADNGSYTPIIESADKILTVEVLPDQIIQLNEIKVDLNLMPIEK